MLATELYVPAFFDEASYPTVAVPPACGGDVVTMDSDPFAGPGDGLFFPLDPSRFSGPQLRPEPGSPPLELAAPYEIVTCSLDGAVPSRNQISPVWVVAFEKFFTPAQSITSQVLTPSVSAP